MRRCDWQCAVKRLARECATEAVRVGGSDPTDEAGNSLLPTGPLPGDYEALAELLKGSATCLQLAMFEEAYQEALTEAQQA
jgi:hypothetical protein